MGHSEVVEPHTYYLLCRREKFNQIRSRQTTGTFFHTYWIPTRERAYAVVSKGGEAWETAPREHVCFCQTAAGRIQWLLMRGN